MAQHSEPLQKAGTGLRAQAAEQAETTVDGGAASALVSAGVGSAALGIANVLAAASKAFSSSLAWVVPAGPLSGKTTVAVLVWLLSWAWLNRQWNERRLDFGRVVVWTVILIALGFLGTFPPVFEMFE